MHVELNLDDYENFDNRTKSNKDSYIVTIDESSGEVLSIYRNYGVDDPNYTRIEYFVHYKFLPGLGFYGFGLIHAIGGLSRAATVALRQLIDAGTFKNLPAGFKSRGIRLRMMTNQPEIRDVDAPGGNIRDQFFNYLFRAKHNFIQSFGFVVQAGQKFAITDTAVGNDTQNRAVAQLFY